MSFSFPKSKRGYKPAEVDAFIERARQQFTHPGDLVITSKDLRRTEFQLVRGGYSVSAVDAAIDRLEDAFAKNEIERAKQFKGSSAIADRTLAVKAVIAGRLVRPAKRRFDTTGLVLRGYDRKQVDRFLNSVQAHIDTGRELDLNSVRRAVFKGKRGGYVESQVDAFIDRVVELLHLELFR